MEGARVSTYWWVEGWGVIGGGDEAVNGEWRNMEGREMDTWWGRQVDGESRGWMQ